MKTTRTYFLTSLCLILSVLTVEGQELLPRRDSLKRSITPDLLIRPMLPDSAKANVSSIHIPTLNPILGKEGLRYNRFDDFSIHPYLMPRTGRTNIQFFGTESNAIFSRSKTAVANYSPTPRMNIYSGATLGIGETPFFGRDDYYTLNAGANYQLSRNLNAGLSGVYNSNFALPFWNVSADLQYMPHPNLMVEGSLGYTQTANNPFGVNQSAILTDLHARYRLSDDWFINAYGGFPVHSKTNMPGMHMLPMMDNTHLGGTLEYWFSPTVGAEAGMIWVRDMFSGKMRPQPKLELKFRPGR